MRNQQREVAASASGQELPPGNFAAWLLSEASPDATAIIDGGRTVSYGQLRVAVRRVAREVTRATSARAGAIIPVVGNNSADQVASYLGVLYAGCVPALIPSDSDNLLRTVVAETSADVALASRDAIARVTPHVKRLLVIGEIEEPSDDDLAGAREVDPDRLAALMYTSGSTGRARGVMVSTRNLWANARQILTFLPLQSDDRAFVTLPFFYCFGASVLHTHLRAGASLLLSTVAYPEALLEALVRGGANGLPGVPTLFQTLLERSTLERAQPSLRYIMVSGGRLRDPLLQRLRTALPGTRVIVRYGVTELTAAASYLPSELLESRLGSIGRGLPDAPLRVEGTDGTPVEPGSGQVGEIIARGPHVALGYFMDGVSTAQAFRGGAFHTGDLATVDGEGFIYISGRLKEFVKTAGHRVAPQEVEEVLARLPQVREVVVYGIPHPIRGEALEAAVVPRDGTQLSEDELFACCSSALPHYKVPVSFKILSEIPTTPSGKVDRARLARQVVSAR